MAATLNNLAGLYEAQGHYAEAEPLYQRSLVILEKALGPEHPHVAASLNNLAELYLAQGHYAQAEPRYKRALAIWEKALGPEHPDVAMTVIRARSQNRSSSSSRETPTRPTLSWAQPISAKPTRRAS